MELSALEGAIQVKITADTSKAIDALKGTFLHTRTIKKKVLSIYTAGIKQSIARELRLSITRRTGGLQNALSTKVASTGNWGRVFFKGSNQPTKRLTHGNRVWAIAGALEKGATASKKKKRGRWHVQGRYFFESGVKNASIDKLNHKVDDMVKKELKKFWG